MDFYISMAFAVLFQILADRKQIVKWSDALAKAFVILEAQANVNPTFAASIQKQRDKR